MKGVVDFFLGLVVLIVGVVLLFLAFLSVRNEQSLLVEAVRQSRDTARLASAQDVGNTSVVQCRQTDDLQAAAEALYTAVSQIWGSEGLVVGVGVLRDPQSWTFFCVDNDQCEVAQSEINQCFEGSGQTNKPFGYFVKFAFGGAFRNFCGIFENNNPFTGEGGDNPPPNSQCLRHEECEPTQYCYAYVCYDCPEGYKRRGVTLGQGAFWFLRNFRLASIYKLFLSLLQAEQLPEGTEGSDDHPFCERCSDPECTPPAGRQTDLN